MRWFRFGVRLLVFSWFLALLYFIIWVMEECPHPVREWWAVVRYGTKAIGGGGERE